MDLYNRGVTEGLMSGSGDDVDLSARSVALPFGPLQLDADPAGFTFGGYQLVHFKSLADYQVRGLRNRYRYRGIGAPLAASVAKGEGPVDPWIGPHVKVPVTALLRFDDPRRGMSEGALHGTIQVLDAGEGATTQVGDLTVPAGVGTNGRARLSAGRGTGLGFRDRRLPPRRFRPTPSATTISSCFSRTVRAASRWSSCTARPRARRAGPR
jgi:hypothetical protein